MKNSKTIAVLCCACVFVTYRPILVALLYTITRRIHKTTPLPPIESHTFVMWDCHNLCRLFRLRFVLSEAVSLRQEALLNFIIVASLLSSSESLLVTNDTSNCVCHADYLVTLTDDALVCSFGLDRRCGVITATFYNYYYPYLKNPKYIYFFLLGRSSLSPMFVIWNSLVFSAITSSI